MVNAAHLLLYSENAEADCGFFRNILGFKSVDAGGGWLIFKLPPAELAVHPRNAETGAGHTMIPAELYLMCDDLPATIKKLEAKNVRCSATSTERWGIRTTVPLPSGAAIGLYQPTHPTAVGLIGTKKTAPRPKARKSPKRKRR